MVWLYFACCLAAACPAQDALALGRDAFERGDYPRAELIYRSYVEQHPASAEGLSNLGAVLARLGKFDAAITTYDKALRANPKLTPVYFNLGVACLRAGRYVQAVEALDLFLKSHPGENRARQLLGLCLSQTGDFRRAILELERVNAAQPGEITVLIALAGAHIRAGDDRRGRQLLQQVERLPGQGAQVHLLRGLLFYRTREYDRAEPEFRRAAELDPSSAPAWAGLGRMHLRVYDDGPAIEYLQKAIALVPQDAESTYQLGVLLYRNNLDEARARALLRRAFELRPDYADPMYALARIESHAQNQAAALQLLERAAKLAPEQESIRYLLARTLQQLGRASEAAAQFAEFRRLSAARKRTIPRLTVEEPALPLDPAQ